MRRCDLFSEPLGLVVRFHDGDQKLMGWGVSIHIRSRVGLKGINRGQLRNHSTIITNEEKQLFY